MRAGFLEGLVDLASHDERVLLLTGDLGYTVLEPFAERYSDRFFNVGVAEQNMIGLATGLAHSGFVPFVYSISAFASMRPYEFIRNGPVLHQLPVRIVGTGAGLDYGNNGVTHYALEDLALMRVQPGLTVVAPADGRQARAAVSVTSALTGPAYFRLGKDGASVPELSGEFHLGRAELIGDGRDTAIVAIGSATRAAVQAGKLLAERGVETTVAVVTSLNPAPVEDLATLFAEVPLVLTVEAHYLAGGVGSLVAEIVAEGGLECRIARAGIADMPRGLTGSPAYLDDLMGLSAERIVERVLAEVAFDSSASSVTGSASGK